VSSVKLKKIGVRFLLTLLTLQLLTYSLPAAQPPDIEEQTRAIAAELRCPVCQNLSVADSPSELAQEMRALVKEQLEQGKSPEEIRKFFVSKYGDWVLLAPPAKGFGLVLWVLPAAGAVLGLLLVVFVTRRWVRRNKTDGTAATSSLSAQANVSPDSDNREFLQGERERIETEEKEIEFDFQSGKLSDADYAAMRRRLAGEAAAVGQKLMALPQPLTAHASPRRSTAEKKSPVAADRRGLKGWQLITGAVFLLLLGLSLGALLMQATRQRSSDQDTITGGFLTGTSSGSPDALMAQGRASFEKRDWPQAIDAFKKVLAIDANHPEANAYMGLMLAQAGHTDGAITAFDRALAADPNAPVALWGKGMLLAQNGTDAAEARRLLEKVSSMMPPGQEKTEVENKIAELGKPGTVKNTAAPTKQSPAQAQAAATAKQRPPAEAQAAGGAIQGVIDVDPKSKPAVDQKAVLFIIAKSTSGAGPPLAVKKIDHPKFPISYSVGPEDVMMPGSVFSGKLFISARLAKDGNIGNKEPGNMAGEYKKNPVDVGAKKIDILLEPMQ
jgi:cytochrome c-type biogenesis protein CcmH